MTKPADEYDAQRIIVEALKEFDPKVQDRIIRYVKEIIGLSQDTKATITTLNVSPPASDLQVSAQSGPTKDIKSFVTSKNPKSDVQFATTIAYYYQFEAPSDKRKNAINSGDLRDACRLVVRYRLKEPGQTLRNANMLGFLDKKERGTFAINTVGENLVAMTLPTSAQTTSKKAKTHFKKMAKQRTKRKR